MTLGAIIFWPFGRASAVMSIGATTLADVFDPIERGTKVTVRFRVQSDPS